MDLDRFQTCPWLAHVGEPLDEPGVRVMGSRSALREALDTDPDGLFAPPYAKPYESACVADHEAARALNKPPPPTVGDPWDAAYELLGPEGAGLVEDDVRTIATLLAHGTLSPFTEARAEWYARGRVPWGYEGTHPDGIWLIL